MAVECLVASRYQDAAQLSVVRTASYDVALTTSGPALRLDRADGSGAQAIVDGIENLQLCYGIDTDGDHAVDLYVPGEKAAILDSRESWLQVIGVRISVLSRAFRDQTTIGSAGMSGSATFRSDVNNNCVDDDSPKPVADRRLRQWFATTVAVRNRLVGLL
jgi:type IV pilus assembly protein PilW